MQTVKNVFVLNNYNRDRYTVFFVKLYRSTLHMMQLILCCLVGLSLTLVSAAPPENCPDDYDATCRTDYRYRIGHDWIPYANSSSGDGVRWRVLVDQHDYQNIFGQFNIPPGKWKEVDADGDGLTVSAVTY